MHKDVERKYGKAMWCLTGACATNYWQPCEEHRCTCCKFGRKVIAYEKQGHCGPCGKREVVTGLRFIRCGKCKAEMVEKAYEAHLKQYVVMMDHSVGRKVPIRCKDFVHTLPKTELPCTQGKRCSKCSNMRPLSYFINEESTCNWHLVQKPDSKAGDDAAPAAKPPGGSESPVSQQHMKSASPAELSGLSLQLFAAVMKGQNTTGTNTTSGDQEPALKKQKQAVTPQSGTPSSNDSTQPNSFTAALSDMGVDVSQSS